MVKFNGILSDVLVLNTGAPKGVFSPLFYILSVATAELEVWQCKITWPQDRGGGSCVMLYNELYMYCSTIRHLAHISHTQTNKKGFTK